jgi:hypothetical protein
VPANRFCRSRIVLSATTLPGALEDEHTMSTDDENDLATLIRQAAARHGDGNIRVVDFADMGELPPELRRAGHIVAQTMGAMDLVATFHEVTTYHLARHIADVLVLAGRADSEGGVDIDVDTVATTTAADPDLLELWKTARPGARRDLLASLVQLLTLTRRRRGIEKDQVAAMIGQHAMPGQLWTRAEHQLEDAVAAGRGWEDEPMLPDGPQLPALTSSPVSVAAEQLVTSGNVDGFHLRSGAAVLLVAATVLETNATGRWSELLSVLDE